MAEVAVNRNETVTTRVSKEVKERAKQNLMSQGITMAEYLRLAVASAANNQVQVVNFLDTAEALDAKAEAENGVTEDIGDQTDFKQWLADL